MKLFVDTANVDEIRQANDMASSAVLQQIRLLSQKRAEILLKLLRKSQLS